jgi:hypothetical protein
MVKTDIVSFALPTDAEVGLKPSCSLTWKRIFGLLFVLAGAAPPLLALPVLGTDEQGRPVDSAVVPARALPSIGTGGLPRLTAPEVSTGNKNLDLLLELQGKAGEDGVMTAKGAAAAASPTAASAAAAKALAALRDKAAQSPPVEDTRLKPALPPAGGLNLLDEDAKRAQPADRREWSGQIGGSGGHRDGPRESGGPGQVDHPLLKLPMEVMTYLRENRFWVLGSIGLLVLLAAALKAYSRRI